MKNLFILFLLPSFLFAQTSEQIKKIVSKTNTAVLRSIASESRDAFIKNKIVALQLAQKNNWPSNFTKDGSYSELVGVDNDSLPIYYTTFNYGAGVTARANKLYSGGALGLNINGENMTAGVWDVSSALPSHELFGGRSQVMDNAADSFYHSTHVAGTIIGSDQFQNGTARGMAYKANADSYDWSDDWSEVATAAGNGLLLSNHSYGRNPFLMPTSIFGRYDSVAQLCDNIMFNAPFYQMVCAAGNSRGNYNTSDFGYDLLTGQALSKNGISVAAVKEVLNYTGPQSVEMSAFSSWGPSDDGRVKPDISAKGVNTFSAIDSSDESYRVLSGTSMAAPSVTGTLLLFQQYYNQLNGNFMKASTLRGLMIHTADEAGTTPGPDYGFGWGLINAERAANVITENYVQSFIKENTLEQGGSYSITVNSLGTEPLLATLCWTDPQGTVTNTGNDNPIPDLVNDLDIRIAQNDSTYFPWKLNPAVPSAAATRGDNIVDNVEKATIDSPSGSYTVTVSHKGGLLNGSQNYSLIISGVTINNFWFTTAESDKIICDGIDSAGFSFDMRTKSNFDDSIALSILGLPLGVSAGFSAPTLTTAGTFQLNLNGLSALAPGHYSFIVKGTGGTESFEMPISVNILSAEFSAIELTLPADGTSSIAMPTVFNWQGDPNAEQYDIEISANADFSSIVQSATVTQNTFTGALLSNSSQYFWRVKPRNRCGSGEFSNVFSFSTVCGLPSDITLVIASMTSAEVGWTEPSGAASWEVEIVAHNAPPTGSGTVVTSNPYVFTNLIKNTCYDVYIRSNCDAGTSSWTSRFVFCTPPDYCGGEHFYDGGGPNGNYHSYENKTTVIRPENTGDRIKAVFNMCDIAGSDYLRVYDGPDTTFPLIFTATGSSPGTLYATNPAGALTFVFTSDSSGNPEGWDATIICEPMPPCPFAPANLTLTGTTDTTATLNWTDNTSSTSWEIKIVPRGTLPTGSGTITSNRPYTKAGLTSGTYYDFYVRSICSAGTSQWSGPVPFVTKPHYCEGDHFYDNGGPDTAYSFASSYSETIYPDGAGNRVKVVFNSFDLDPDYSLFHIYDGPTLLFSYDGTNSPGTYVATHLSGALTFEVHAYAGSQHQGWDATVTCEPLPPCLTPPDGISTYNDSFTSTYIHWTENSAATSWEIEIVPHGNTPTGTGIVTATMPFHQTGLLSNTVYDVYVRSRCGSADSAWSEIVTFSTDYDYCGGDHFYDDGGPNSNYSAQSYVERSIYPDVAGDRIKAVFNTFSIAPNTTFKVYDGFGGPLLFSADGTNSPGTLIANNPSGNLFYSFNSGSVTAEGWDATIICEPIAPCSFPPSNVSTSNITTTSARLYWYEDSQATSWDVEIVPHGTAPSGSGIVTLTRPYTVTGLTANTWYDCYIRSVCGSVNSAPSSVVTFHTAANYCLGDHFYDSGGPADNYPASENRTTTISPTGSGNRVKATFNSFILGTGATFKVYNGPNASAPLIYNSTENVDPGVLVSTHLSGTLTFSFSNSSAETGNGWDASIVCEPLPPCSNPPTNITIYSNPTATTAGFNWTDNSGASSWEIEIVPLNSMPTGIGTAVNSKPFIQNGLTANTWYRLYVRSKCGSATSLWSDPFPFYTEGNYCAGDHFYDPGGPTANYPASTFKNTKIVPATAGDRVLMAFNSFALDPSDYFEVYDGPDFSYPLVFAYDGLNSPGTFAASNAAGAFYIIFRSFQNTAPGWDATVTCEPQPPCSSVPRYLNTTDIETTSALLGWTENSGATEWEVEIELKGVTPSGSGILATTNPHAVSGLTSNTKYDFYVRSKCGNYYSPWVGPISFTTKADYCSGDHFYDDGGAGLNYQALSSASTTIFPDNPGDRIRAVFHAFQLYYDDPFRIYDGPNSSYPLVYSHSYYSTNPATVVATNPSGALTFEYGSNYDYTSIGWDASITCEPIPACAIQPSNITTAFAMMQSIVLNWTDNSNAGGWEVEVVPRGSIPTEQGVLTSENSFTITGLTVDTCYDAYVRAICGTVFSGWTLFSFCSQPDYCGGIHFYDSGGATGNYQGNELKLTVIYPENPGEKVKATFNTFNVQSGYDQLQIYDGPDTTSPIFGIFSGISEPGSYTSSHPTGALTFLFASNDTGNFDGWDATIDCLALATANQDAFAGLEYYPNPVREQFHIKSKNKIESYEVYDVNSRLILQKNINKDEFDIKMSNVSTGIYFVKLTVKDGGSKNIKILKS